MRNELIGSEKLVVPVEEQDHIRGPFDAPMTLLEYGDFECPWCRKAREFVEPVRLTLGPQLRFVFRNFPLTEIHPYAEGAAEAAEAAGAQGKFWEMHDILYEHQDTLDGDSLVEYARELELDVDRFVTGIENGEFVSRLRRDFKSGARSGVDGTPTFFVNGFRYIGPDEPERLMEALSKAPRRKVAVGHGR